MKRNFVWMLAAMLAMAACSKSVDDGPGNGDSEGYVGGKGFVNIGINLPTSSSALVRSSVTEEDGTADEYKVNNVIVALFYGQTPEAAQCRHAFQINGDDFQNSGIANDGVTTSSVTGVRMISAPKTGEKVYALALVNAPSRFGITGSGQSSENEGNAALSTKLKVGTTDPFTGTLDQLNDAITAVNIGAANNFFMTNASIAVQEQTETKAQTLAPITVYKDKSYAEGAANPIYVERAAAKVAVQVKDGTINDNTLPINSEKYSYYEGATVKFEGWYLQSTNKTFYPVRKVSESAPNNFDTWKTYGTPAGERFIGTSSPKRILWAVDPNYEPAKGSEGEGLTSVETVDNGNWIEMGSNGYCAENTTTAANMTGKALTSVLLKAQFTPKDAQPNANFFMLDNLNAIYTETEFLTWAKNTLTDAGHKATGELSIGTGITAGRTITTPENVKLLVQSTEGGELSDDQANALLDAAGNNIKFYKGGVTYYYAAIIKHFGKETPYTGDATDVAYEESKHLGRYGVVRNTWYELTINSVSGPGEPEIPEVPDTPADEKDNYINCEINILSWAKRTQGVDL